MKILLTGGSGFIGQEFIKKYEHKYELFLLLREEPKFQTNCTYFVVDLLHEKNVDLFITQNNTHFFDCCIHFASEVVTINNVNNINIINNNNIIVYNIIKIVKAFTIYKFINLSSVSVYPNENAIFNEESIVNPEKNGDALYGLAKFNCEVIINVLLKNSNINICHVRAAMVTNYAKNERGLIGTMIREMLAENKITIYGTGNRIINFVTIEDLFLAIDKYIRVEIKQRIINVVSKNITILEIAEILKTIYCKVDVELNILNDIKADGMKRIIKSLYCV